MFLFRKMVLINTKFKDDFEKNVVLFFRAHLKDQYFSELQLSCSPGVDL